MSEFSQFSELMAAFCGAFVALLQGNEAPMTKDGALALINHPSLGESVAGDFTVKQLRDLAGEFGIPGRHKMKKLVVFGEIINHEDFKKGYWEYFDTHFPPNKAVGGVKGKEQAHEGTDEQQIERELTRSEQRKLARQQRKARRKKGRQKKKEAHKEQARTAQAQAEAENAKKAEVQKLREQHEAQVRVAEATVGRAESKGQEVKAVYKRAADIAQSWDCLLPLAEMFGQVDTDLRRQLAAELDWARGYISNDQFKVTAVTDYMDKGLEVQRLLDKFMDADLDLFEGADRDRVVKLSERLVGNAHIEMAALQMVYLGYLCLGLVDGRNPTLPFKQVEALEAIDNWPGEGPLPEELRDQARNQLRFGLTQDKNIIKMQVEGLLHAYNAGSLAKTEKVGERHLEWLRDKVQPNWMTLQKTVDDAEAELEEARGALHNLRTQPVKAAA